MSSVGCVVSQFDPLLVPNDYSTLFSYADKKRGWYSAHPAFSCKEILDSGHSRGDGEYWIDPEKSGNPLKVYCDMSRSGGKRMNFSLRDEDFNRSIFDLEHFLLERSGLGYSFFLYKDHYYDWLSSAGRFEH